MRRLTLFFAATLTACAATSSDIDSGGGGGNIVYIWLAADKDSYTSCGAAGPPCPANSLVHGQEGFVSVGFNGVDVRKGYVHFGLPNLPAGATLQEAYFEMFYAGRNEDGQTDDVQIPVGRASGPWTVATLSRSNEPNTSLVGGEYSIRLRPQSWSGTANLADIVNAWYSSPASNNGFYIYWPTLSPGIQKGFYSNNDIRRTVNDLGLSPRLLLKVQLAEGQTAADITLPAVLADNDLEFPGQTILMARTRTQSDWPSDWEVRLGQ